MYKTLGMKLILSLATNVTNHVPLFSTLLKYNGIQKEQHLKRLTTSIKDHINSFPLKAITMDADAEQKAIALFEASVDEKEALTLLLQNLLVGCEGNERKLARKILMVSCGGGRESILEELLLKWTVKTEDGKVLETSYNGSNCPTTLDPYDLTAYDTASATDFYCSCPNPNIANANSGNLLTIPAIGY